MTDWRMIIDRELDGLADDLRAIRRHLHIHPEPSREEYQTTLFLGRKLEEAGIPFRVVPSGRGIIAGPEPVKGLRRVACRADMDALRLQDLKEVAYRSSRD
ncbi:M20 metallopeptidase family protein, partial [Singulisphaera rosea]